MRSAPSTAAISTRAIGLRDRAVLLILARLGLRAHEIIALQLEDCDWDRGCLRVRGKGGHVCALPMPVDVGQAIAAYLERGRPVSEDRHLFLRSVAPIRGLLPGSDGVGSIVRYALRRAKVDAPHRGSHQFRHALAVRMLQGGASLPEIGEVLRHRSPQSSSIYAKVDLEALRSLGSAMAGRCAMNTLREALQDYLALRRGLGYKMHDAGRLLPRFVSFLEERHAPAHHGADWLCSGCSRRGRSTGGMGSPAVLRARLRSLPQRC